MAYSHYYSIQKGMGEINMKLKKLLSVIIAAGMLFTSSAFAYSDYEDTADTRILSALGIMSGYDDGTFLPDGNLTRSEAVKILVYLYGRNVLAENMTKMLAEGKTPAELQAPVNAFEYTDIDTKHWAYGYWYYAVNLGIINGYGDGTLHPEENVTYSQFLKMTVALLGYTSLAESMGEYPQGFVDYAKVLSLTSDIEFDPNAPVLRKDAAKIIGKALNVPLRIVTGIDAQWNGEAKYTYEICDGKGGRQYLTLIENLGYAKANADVRQIIGDTATIKISSSRFLDDKRYPSDNVKEITVPVGDFGLRRNKTYTMLIQETDNGYEIKYIY